VLSCGEALRVEVEVGERVLVARLTVVERSLVDVVEWIWMWATTVPSSSMPKSRCSPL